MHIGYSYGPRRSFGGLCNIASSVPIVRFEEIQRIRISDDYFSLGNAAVFLIGGSTRDEEPIPILLRSGDAVVMAGPRCRRAYHGRVSFKVSLRISISDAMCFQGVPRILERSLPGHLQPGNEHSSDWDVFGRYMQTTRINVNVRQVFPKGFDPLILGAPEAAP